MEEWVGQAWHNLITRAADREHHDAAVVLEDVRHPAGFMFRALGGPAGSRVEAATATAHGARRTILSRLAGSNRSVELAWFDGESLRLPARLAVFPDRALNRELYIWLAALAASQFGRDIAGPSNWLEHNVAAAAHLLCGYPGLRASYRRLSLAHLEQRPNPNALSGQDAMAESLIRKALQDPTQALDSGLSLPANLRRKPQPVPLFLNPDPPATRRVRLSRSNGPQNASGATTTDVATRKRRRGEYVDEPDDRGGLIAFRLESLFSRTEFVAVDRTQEENEDPDSQSGIEDLDVLSVSRTRDSSSKRLRFDLDLPAADYDDVPVGEGIPLPEWDYRRGQLVPDHCRVQVMTAREPLEAGLPTRLRRQAVRLRNLFEMLLTRRVWQKAQLDGSELDLPSVVRRMTDQKIGMATSEAPVYCDFRNLERDLSCLVLADLSLSTDAFIDDDKRVIDVIRESLHLLTEALAGTGDRFALYGFSSRHRDHVRLHALKAFEEVCWPRIHGRIAAIKPGYYTRMGAAIRYGTQLLERESSARKLLILLTDGKPNDLDCYEGRYGIEDSRMAVRECFKQGIQTFCVTVDRTAGDYLPYLFGSDAYLLLRDAQHLPVKLPSLYARLTSVL